MLSNLADELDEPATAADVDASEIYDAVAENFLAEIRCSVAHRSQESIGE